MLSLEELRKVDPDLAHLSDEELIAMRDDMYAVAQIAFDAWYGDVSKNPVGLSQSADSGSTI